MSSHSILEYSLYTLVFSIDMWKTAILLIFTLLVVPVIAFNIDVSPTDIQKSIIKSLLIIYISSSLLCFFVSTISKNYSQVDKLWSLLPILYVWVVYLHAQADPRILVMALLVTFWGLRLSYNFARRGGYHWKFWKGEEDYRWAVLMQRAEFKPEWKWMLFNLFFISFYQLGLILLFTLPIVKSFNGGPLGLFDYLLSALIILLIMVETIADQQQWMYHVKKRTLNSNNETEKEDLKKGFVSSGLWALVRHPNYAAEQMIWIAFYLFSVSATGIWINWSITGCLLLILLFKGSSDFSESISKAKYPAYETYQQTVPRFIPFSKW